MPSHVSISGNKHTDRLPDKAHTGNKVASYAPNPKRAGKQAVSILQELYRKAHERQPQISSRSMSRHSSTLLHRLRTNSAHTREQLHRMEKCDDHYCTHCREIETLQHIILGCHKYDSTRAELFTRVRRGPTTRDPSLEQVFFPDGPASH